jgi:sugar lactone lactonase YvrE
LSSIGPQANSLPLERWRSCAGVSWDAPNRGADPAPFANSVNSPICGVHFDAKGRAFVTTPRLMSANSSATLSILDTSPTAGPARLTAFPSLGRNAVGTAPDQNLRSVLGFYVDKSNGWLWALDQGFVAGESEAPAGAQKVMVYDLDTGRTVKRIGLDGAADRDGSFLNDIAVDEARKVAYSSDSGLRSAPENKAGVIVVDFATGAARRTLDRHPAVCPEPGVKVMSNGAEVWPGKPLMLGINGIALSPEGKTLYWAVTTGRNAFSAPTEILRDAKASETAVSASVVDLGEVGGSTDGIVTDAAGNLYITDVSRGGIVKYDPRTNTMALLASDMGVHWPDTATIEPGGDLVFTSSNLNQHLSGAVKPGEERFELRRLQIA